MTQKTCKFCGATFNANYFTQKYCSAKCRQRNQTIKTLKKTKICEVCSKEFQGADYRRYCSARCRTISLNSTYNKNMQLCWTCQRATGFCSWSARLKPVEGWNAKKVVLGDGNITYKIKACPLYLPDEYLKMRNK